MRPLLVLALAACAPPPSAGTGPLPPPVMTLEAPAAWLSDAPNLVRVHGVPAGRPAHLVASFATSGDFYCPAPTAPACFNLFGPASYLGPATADAASTATWVVALPPGTTDPTGTMQAVAVLRGGGLAFSEAQDRPIVSATGDADGDGVSNADELAAGTDPFVAACGADSDGDGVCDPFDACSGDDATGDSDGDAVCDDLDACLGDDATGDTDADAVCDDSDLCTGDDATGDTDADGVCGDLEDCQVYGLPQANGTCRTHGTILRDAFVCSDDEAALNFGAETYSHRAVGRQNAHTGNQIGRAFYAFSLAPTAPGATIVSATLHLKLWDNFAGSPMIVEVRESVGPWTEGGLTWNNQPAVTSVVLDVATAACCGTTYAFDVTSAVTAAMAAGRSNLSLRLASADEATEGGLRWFFREGHGVTINGTLGEAPRLETVSAPP